MLGRLPSVQELDAFLAEPARSKAQIQAKRAALVDRLLGTEYAADYVNHWSAMWTNTLIGRTGGRMRRSLTSREGMRDYLTAALFANKPYDELAAELITATGSATPEAEDLQRRGQLSDREAGRRWRAGDRQDCRDLSRHRRAMHAVP